MCISLFKNDLCKNFIWKVRVLNFNNFKTLLLHFWGWKINLSGISPAKRSRSGPNSDMSRTDNVQGILGAIGPFWAKWGLGQVPRSLSLLCGNPEDHSATLQRPIFTEFSHETYSSVSRQWIRKDIFETFYFRGHLPPKSENENRSNRHLTQSRLQVTGCIAERYCLLHVVVQGPGSFRGRSTYCMTYGCGATRRQIFYNFRTCRWPAYSPGVILQNHSIFPRGSRKSKGVPSGTGDFLRLLVGDLATPKLVQIFVYGKWLYPYIMLLHGALDLDQKCLKTHNSEDKCTFPPNIFTPTAKITRNPHFGGTFNAKPIIQSVAR